MKSYLVATAKTIAELEAKIDQCLSEGWELQGGITAIVDNSQSGVMFIQAMALPDDLLE
jgi:hypothetical protein